MIKSDLILNQIKNIKDNFKNKDQIKIENKIEQQILKEKEIHSNYSIYDSSFFKYNIFKNEEQEFDSFDVIDLNKEESLHVFNLFVNIFNKANFHFPYFYPFCFGLKDTNEFLFEKKEGMTLLEFFKTKDQSNTLKKDILKLIFYHLYYLNTVFDFTHYNISLSDFLIQEKENYNYFCKTPFDLKEKYILENLNSYTISFNPSALINSCKHAFFIVDSISFGSVTRSSIKKNITENLIKFDRKNMLTDIFNILKEFFLLKNKDTFFFDNLEKVKNIKNIDLNAFSFEKFITNDFFKLNEIRFNSVVSITRHDDMLDYIEFNKTNLIEEESDILDPIENYIKNFSSSLFLQNIKNFCETEQNSIDKEYLKINFYIFCRLKNYFFQNSKPEEKEKIKQLYKTSFLFLYEKIKIDF